MLQSKQNGFSLIEVLVALAFLTIISLSVIQLLTRSQQAAEIAREDFVATNLAREGLELVRDVRDTNWFSTVDRSLWIDQEMCNAPFTYDAASLRNHEPVGSQSQSQLYIQTNGEWAHTPTGEATQYDRILTVNCSEKDNDPAYVTVQSRVTWLNRGQPHDVVLQEKLYNWLP